MLASNMFFWDWVGSPSQPTPPPSDAEQQAAQRNYGARGRDYHPLPEDYWLDRAKIIQVDKRDPRKVFEVPEMPGPPKVLNPAIAMQVSVLSAQRGEMAATLMSLPDVPSMTKAAGDIKLLDRQIAFLNTKKYH